jgi:FixJ family two-component response regulator
LRAPAIAAALATPDRTGGDPFRPADAIPAPFDRHAAHALLARQCRSRIDGLAPRQRDVLAGLVAGHSNKQVAHMLGISPRTIELYRASMMERLKVRTLAQALYIAFMAGFAPPDTLSLES